MRSGPSGRGVYTFPQPRSRSVRVAVPWPNHTVLAMRAVTWQGKRNIAVKDVPEPRIEEPKDAIVRITSTALCGSDLHLYELMSPFLEKGDVLGHEPMGIVEEVGPEVGNLKAGDRVVVGFNIACGQCWMCRQGLTSQCEVTQVRDQNTGAALFGYTKLYGQVPGGQAEYLRVPHADFTAMQVPQDGPDERFLFLSDVLPTAWQAVEYAGVPGINSLAVLGLGPVGDMCVRVARQRGVQQIFATDLVPERLQRAHEQGATVFNAESDDFITAIRDATDGRGPDAVIDAVGTEAHGTPAFEALQKMADPLPDPLQAVFMKKAGVDRMAALYTAIDLVRRGGTVSLIGVYSGMADPMPMMILFDKQVQLRMGQANVRTWTNDLMPLVLDGDPLQTESFATHILSLEDAPIAYERFQKKEDGMIKVVFKP
jgi:threonine dehydrogenase-like Zn-dependent dehydrogenase